jgi:hypothetical protein
VKHSNKVLTKVLAKVYRPCLGRDSCRVTWYAAGQRQMKSFPTYAGPGGAKEYAEALVVELAKNSQAVTLQPAQATGALAFKRAHERLDMSCLLLMVGREARKGWRKQIDEDLNVTGNSACGNATIELTII